jgi:hypothetical protein
MTSVAYAVHAINNLRNAYAQAAGHIGTMALSGQTPVIKVAQEDLDDIYAAGAAVEALQQNPADITIDALQALSRAAQIVGNARGPIANHPGARLPGEITAYLDMFVAPVRPLEKIVGELVTAADRRVRAKG